MIKKIVFLAALLVPSFAQADQQIFGQVGKRINAAYAGKTFKQSTIQIIDTVDRNNPDASTYFVLASHAQDCKSAKNVAAIQVSHVKNSWKTALSLNLTRRGQRGCL